MRANTRHILLAATGLLSVVCLGLGWLFHATTLTGAGAAGAIYVFWRLGVCQRPFDSVGEASSPQDEAERPPQAAFRAPADPNDLDAVVEQMLAQQRYALLLRPQIACRLSDGQFHRALEALENGMALVPDGEVVIGRIDHALDDGRLDDEEIRAHHGRIIRVEHFFLDRYPVTNRQFYEFVAADGYAQMALWDSSIWPAVLDFVDQTGDPGPRLWKRGCYASGFEDHPVVGVSWYEAAAYARWLGKRLPTDPEWVKAGSWPVSLSASSRMQRKYPWGDTMELGRANLWGNGRQGTAAVGECPGGMSVGGVYQLIGNVWEWTRGDYHADSPNARILSEVLVKSIRGGAFDTYFDNQATCQFQSGELAVGRKPNIGFRCAVGVCDLMLSRAAPSEQTPAEEICASAEEAQA